MRTLLHAAAVLTTLLSPAAVVAAEYERGWIADIVTSKGERLASYYDEDSSWYSTDVENVIPIDGIANDGIFDRHTKLVVKEEAEYSFTIRSFAPLLNNAAKSITFTLGENSLPFTSNDAFAPCNVSAEINGQPILKQGYNIQLTRGGYAETSTTPALLEPGVYDFQVKVGCRWSNYLALGARKAVGIDKKNPPEHWAFGYDIVQGEGNPKVDFAVLKSDLDKAFPSGSKRTIKLSIGKKIPEGFESGWVVSTLPNFGDAMRWPTVPPLPSGVANAATVSTVELDYASKENRALQLSSMFTAPEDGNYVFGIGLTVGDVVHPGISSTRGFVQSIQTMFRVESVVFPAMPITHHRGEFVNDKLFGNVSHLKTWSVELKAGQTYQLAYLFKPTKSMCERRRGGCEKYYLSGKGEKGFYPGSEFQMMILPPSERGIRHMKATEVLHAVTEAN